MSGQSVPPTYSLERIIHSVFSSTGPKKIVQKSLPGINILGGPPTLMAVHANRKWKWLLLGVGNASHYKIEVIKSRPNLCSAGPNNNPTEVHSSVSKRILNLGEIICWPMKNLKVNLKLGDNLILSCTNKPPEKNQGIQFSVFAPMKNNTAQKSKID